MDGKVVDSETPASSQTIPNGSTMPVTWTHPLFGNVDAIGTRPVDEVYALVGLTLLTGGTSCAFAAASSTGKTFCIKKIKRALDKDFGGVPVIHIDTKNLPADTLREFFKNWLHGLGYSKIDLETGDLRELVFTCLTNLARRYTPATVILLLDETQELRDLDMKFLKDTYNLLIGADVRMISILFGEYPRFLETVSNWDECIVNRFAQHRYIMRGLRDLKDFSRILREIDEAPLSTGSSETWTSSLFPQACAAGFRLESQAESLMEAFAAADRGRHKTYSTGKVFGAIKALITAQRKHDAPGMVIQKSAWVTAVQFAQGASVSKNVKNVSRAGWTVMA